ncbi:hypothetical protein GWA01_17590 [Gluconobacter wancherniae NBRC 103581]|uniref:Uncharacterized protein n=1 Tax=Gluconobacter wancherniae NBRC 103581 TaxID=656744 RepID=A0A511B0L1_9PROT|nr:hypothetical protein GWA01_17590 [Gluconobacter wancherniae NBRC 103581]
MACAQIVEHHYVMPGIKQALGDVASDKSGATGDETFHVSAPVSLTAIGQTSKSLRGTLNRVALKNQCTLRLKGWKIKSDI